MAFIVFNTLRKAEHYLEHMNVHAQNQEFYFKISGSKVLKIHTYKVPFFDEVLFTLGYEEEDNCFGQITKEGYKEVIGRIKQSYS